MAGSNLVLVRHAPRRAEIRRQRLVTLAGRVQRPAELSAVLMSICVVFAIVTGPRIVCGGCKSKQDITKIVVKKYAYEAYPSWSAENPDRACPHSLHELAQYMNADSSRDTWGSPLVFWCAATPRGTQLMVTSAGEDGQFGTADDIRSWE